MGESSLAENPDRTGARQVRTGRTVRWAVAPPRPTVDDVLAVDGRGAVVVLGPIATDIAALSRRPIAERDIVATLELDSAEVSSVVDQMVADGLLVVV